MKTIWDILEEYLLREKVCKFPKRQTFWEGDKPKRTYNLKTMKFTNHETKI